MSGKVTPPNFEEDVLATQTTHAAATKDSPQSQDRELHPDLNGHDDEEDSPVESRETFFLSQLATLQAEVDEQKNRTLRAVAEMENIRRRAQEDVLKASRFAIENFAEQLLSVKDSLEMALANPNSNLDNLRQGIELTLKQLNSAFDRAKIVEVISEGLPFDPHVHQAVTTIDSNKPANTVVQVHQKGYRLNDRVLRPALVVVAKGS